MRSAKELFDSLPAEARHACSMGPGVEMRPEGVWVHRYHVQELIRDAQKEARDEGRREALEAAAQYAEPDGARFRSPMRAEIARGIRQIEFPEGGES